MDETERDEARKMESSTSHAWKKENSSMNTGRAEAPILEFDSSRGAITEPTSYIKPSNAPEHCVPCFFQDIIARIRRERRTKTIASFKCEDGHHRLYEISINGKRLAFFQPGFGASAAAARLEDVIAAGCRKFIACGSAGVLDDTIAVGHVIVPEAAVRDEGASYHYLPASREVRASPEGVAAIERVLKLEHIRYTLAKTWTTDGPYRETPAKIRLRRAEGCLTVEMEAAACFAVAQFRKVILLNSCTVAMT